MSSQQTDYRSIIPAAASHWRKETLDPLNVHYDPHSVTDFKFDTFTLPDELEKSMARFIKSAKSSNRSNRQGFWANQWFEGNNVPFWIEHIPTSFDDAIREILWWFSQDTSQKFTHPSTHDLSDNHSPPSDHCSSRSTILFLLYQFHHLPRFQSRALRPKQLPTPFYIPPSNPLNITLKSLPGIAVAKSVLTLRLLLQ